MKLCNSEQCSGCGACVSACPKNAITLERGQDGFRYPYVSMDKCVDCHMCEKACPVLSKRELNQPINTFAVFAQKGSIRMRSASGGIATVLGKVVIERGGIVFGVQQEDGLHARFEAAKSEEKLLVFQNSKYVESDLGDSYNQVLDFLKKGSKVLFIGLPCQVAGLLNVIPKMWQEELYTVDLICHGTPSEKLLEQCVKRQYGENAKVRSFRNEEAQYFMKVDLGEKNIVYPASADLYYNAFIEGYAFRHSCYQCLYAQNKRCADLTIGDFWGIGEEIPYAYNKKKVSCVLQNTEKGQEMLKWVKPFIQMDKRSFNEAVIQNAQLTKPSEFSPKAKKYHELCAKFEPYQSAKKISGRKVQIERIHWHLACLKRKILTTVAMKREV